MHVLFVCNGNVCRSAIAERLTRALAVDYELPRLTAESAGTRALVGFPVEPLAAQTIAGLGGDPEGFRARKLTPELVDRADLILAMTDQLRDQAGGMGFGAPARSFTLLEARRIAKLTGARTIGELHAARDDLAYVHRENIADPIGLSAQSYCEVGDRIAEAVVPLLLALAPYEQQRPVAEAQLGLVIRPQPRAPLSAFLAANRTR